ncbi:MAG: hypothetical protein KatS3mg014_0449 [Actinomycetota bacterium]|nr:MAG: hypothetical protein KatS3mg014_0449 [Actinomycetota bacterium]
MSASPYAREAAELAARWRTEPRWRGIERPYTAEDVIRLRGPVRIEHTLARRGAERLYRLLTRESYVRALGAMTGGQAVQMVRAGLEAIYVSGWQVAADVNLAGETYPDQSLYPANSAPALVRRINRALLRADQIAWSEGDTSADHLVPIVADAEAGFGGPLNAFELMKAMIEAGAAGVHFEDQLASEKKCGHLGGKVLVPDRAVHPDPRRRAPRGRRARRADRPHRPHRRRRRDPPHLGRGPRDRPFLTGERTPEGFFRVRTGIEAADRPGAGLRALRRRALVRDLRPDLDEAGPSPRRSHEALPRQAPRVQLLALLQLAPPPRAGGDRALPGRARRHGLPVPVRDPGGVPRPERRDVRARARLRPPRACAPTCGCRSASSPSRPRATPPRATSARSARATSTSSQQTVSGGELSTLALEGSTEAEQFAEPSRPSQGRSTELPG